jgi:hypothetical protein
MLLLVAVALLIAAGALFLLRSEPPAPSSPSVADPAAAAKFRDRVLAELGERVVGWTWEPVADNPLEISGLSSASGQRRLLELGAVFAAWRERSAQGQSAKAAEVLEDFIEGATGARADEAPSGQAVDLDWVRGALAVALLPPAHVPADGFVRAVGALSALLVLRHPGEPEPVTAEDLAAWGMSEPEAFAIAYENLVSDVADGLATEAIAGSEDRPEALSVAPGDPLAGSYALVPALAERLRKRFGGPVALWLAATDVLYAAPAGRALEQDDDALVKGPLEPANLEWPEKKGV